MRSLDPACKLISLVYLTMVLAWRYDPVLNFTAAAVCILFLFAAKVPFRQLIAVFFPIVLGAAGMFVTGYRFSSGSAMPVNSQLFSAASSNLSNALAQASRVLAYGAAGCLFALTTDGVRMVKSFQRQFHLPQVFAFGLLAAWGMVGQMFGEYRRTKAAFQARGLRVFPFSPALLKPLLVKSVRWSEALSIAMESKGFSPQAPRSDYEPAVLRRTDLLFVAFSVILPLLFIVLFP